MQNRMKLQADRNRTDKEYHAGDQDFLYPRNLQEGEECKQHQPCNLQEGEDRFGKLKFTMPKFFRGIDPEDDISWALKVGKIFQVHNFNEPKKIAIASLEFDEYALLWWEQVQDLRREQ